MRAIVEASERGELGAQVSVVISPKDETPAVQWARDRGVQVAIVEPDADEAERLLAAIKGSDLLCLAGFLRLLPREVLTRYYKPILNIHPALLPKYGGKGMYGMHVHEAVLAAGEQESGVTVHLVTENYDDGEIVSQVRCPVCPGETAETLAARVLELEHTAYPQAIRKVLNG